MRDLPQTVAASKGARGFSIRCALRVSFTSGDYCYTSEGWDPGFTSCTNRERVVSWGGINALLESRDPKSFAQASFSIVIGDPDGELRDMFEDEQLQKRACEIYWAVFVPGEVEPRYTQAVRILTGTLVPPVVWTEGDRNISFTVTDLSVYDERLVGVRCLREDFPYIAKDDEGAIVPLIYGRVDRVKPVHVTRGPVAHLLEYVDSAGGVGTTFVVDDAEDFPQSETIDLIINHEVIEASIAGNLVTISARAVDAWNGGSATANSTGSCTVTDTKLAPLAVPDNAFVGFEIIVAPDGDPAGNFAYLRLNTWRISLGTPTINVSPLTDQSRFIVNMSQSQNRIEYRTPLVIERWRLFDPTQTSCVIEGAELGFRNTTAYTVGTREQAHQEGDEVYMWFRGQWDHTIPGTQTWPYQDYIVAMGTCTARQVYVHGHLHKPRTLLIANYTSFIGSLSGLEEAWRQRRERMMKVEEDRWIPLRPEMYTVDTTTVDGQTVTRIRMVCRPTWLADYICDSDDILVDVTGPVDPDGDPIQNPAEVIENVFEVYGDIAPKRGLAAWWRMDEASDARVAADSSDDNPATLEGDATFQPSNGRIDGCVDLPGVIGDYVEAANTLSLYEACRFQFTLTWWMRSDEVGDGSNAWGVLHKKSAWDAVTGFYIYYDDSAPAGLYVYGSDGATAAKGVVTISPGWHHYAVVFDGATVQVYEDGVALTMATDTIALVVNNTDPFIMGDPSTAGSILPWNGQFDDVRVYDRRLNVNEIAALATGTKTHVDTSDAQASLTNWNMNFARHAVTPLRDLAADLASQSRSRIRWLDDDPEMLYLGVDGGPAHINIDSGQIILHSGQTSREEIERAASRVRAQWQRDGESKVVEASDATAETELGERQFNVDAWAYENAAYPTALIRYELEVRKHLHDMISLAATVHGVAVQPGDIIRVDPTYVAANQISEFDANLLRHAGDFAEDDNWTQENLASVEAYATPPPTNIDRADKLIEAAGVATHGLSQAYILVYNGTPYVFSVYAHAGERSQVEIRLSSTGFPGTPRVGFDLNDHHMFNVLNVDDYGIEDVGDGWHRCWIRATADADTNSAFVVIVMAVGELSTYAGDGTSGLYLAAASMHSGTSPDEYMPTWERNGVRTNISLRSGGMTPSAYVNRRLVVDRGDDENIYDIADNGATWFRVHGDVDGDGHAVDATVEIIDPAAYDPFAIAPVKARVISATHDVGREPDVLPQVALMAKTFRWAGCRLACEGDCETTSCESACETYYEPDTTCWTCETSCQELCELGCETGAETFCRDHGCETAQQAGCFALCQGTLMTGSCGACETTCQSAGCETSCDTPCMTSGCEASCETVCESECQNPLQSFCSDPCQTECQTDCQTECQTDCQTECQTDCQSECQTDCQIECQTLCQSECQEFCQTEHG